MRRRLLAVLLLATGLAQAEPPLKPYVRVNGVAISQIRFDTMLQLAVAQGGKDSPELRLQLRAQLIAQELLRQEAAKKKLQNDPAVIAARDAALNRAMIERYITTTVKPQAVTEADVHARFDMIVQSLGEREYKPSVIAVSTESEARQILKQVQTAKGFAEQARQHSLLSNGKIGGTMDWVSFPLPLSEGRTAGLPIPLARTISALSPGMVTAEPLLIEGRYWLVRLDESRPTQVPAYADVQNTIRRTLEAQALEKASAELMRQLLAAAKIE